MLKTTLLLLVLHGTQGLPERWYDHLDQQRPSSKELPSIATLYQPEDSGNANSLSQDSQGTEQRRTVVGPAPICKGSTFCEDIPDYPLDIVTKELEKKPAFVNYAFTDQIQPRVQDLVQRIDVPEAEPLCLSTERLIYPRSAQTINNNWMYVVNQANFAQAVRIEACEDEDSSCKVIDGFAQGYTTACKQKYIYRQLSAIADNGTIVTEFFRLPASCCCHVQFTGTIARRDFSPSKKPVS